jgi:hypothetical protein
MALGVRQRQRQGRPGGVLLHGDQARHAAAVDELPAHEVARALRRDHGDVDAGRRGDEAEADVEAVPKNSASPSCRLGATSASYSLRCTVSGAGS